MEDEAINKEYCRKHGDIKKEYKEIIKLLEEKIRKHKAATTDVPLTQIKILTFAISNEDWSTFINDQFTTIILKNEK